VVHCDFHSDRFDYHFVRSDLVHSCSRSSASESTIKPEANRLQDDRLEPRQLFGLVDSVHDSSATRSNRIELITVVEWVGMNEEERPIEVQFDLKRKRLCLLGFMDRKCLRQIHFRKVKCVLFQCNGYGKQHYFALKMLHEYDLVRNASSCISFKRS
jgi:hypothetical protein